MVNDVDLAGGVCAGVCWDCYEVSSDAILVFTGSSQEVSR